MQGRGGFHAEARGRLDVRGRGRAGGQGQANAQGQGQANAGGQGQATVDQPVPSAPPCPQIHRAKRPPRFHGMLRAMNRPARRPPGHPRIQRPGLTPSPRQPPLQPPPAGQPPVQQPPPAEPPAEQPPVEQQPAPPPEPTPEDLASPPPPPDTPPDNPFGYDRPVLGCLEGQVYFIEANSPTLPPSYAGLESSSVLYACEWDIPTRSWDQGFPGIPDRFEWFAIRYSGAFNVATAGHYRFRISSDDGAKLTIDGNVVVDNDGTHPPREAAGDVELSAGDHTVVLEYFQGPRFLINLQVWVTPPGEGASEGLFSVRSE